MEGFVTSSYESGTLKGRICLALVRGGAGRQGEVIEAVTERGPVPVRICSPVFYDPHGARRDGV
jgi:sarcosine oxidase subunit alpha